MGNIISYFFPQPQPAPASIEDASHNNVAAAVPQFVVENQKSELVRYLKDHAHIMQLTFT